MRFLGRRCETVSPVATPKRRAVRTPPGGTESAPHVPSIMGSFLPARIMRYLAALVLVVCTVGTLSGGETRRPKIVMLIAGQSYATDRTLPEFAARFLTPRFDVDIADGAMGNPEHRFANFETVMS